MAGTDRKASGTFSVASYNIHRCVGWDRRCDPARVAQIINDLDADIVGLQEVASQSGSAPDSYQMNYLAEATGLTAIAGPTIRTHTGDYGNVLLTNRRIHAARLLDLSVPGRERRGAIDACIEINGEPVRVIVAHFGLGRAERRYQAQQLLTALTDRRTRMEIVLCDLNEWLPIGPCLKWLDGRLGKSSCLRSFPSLLPFLALDRIWVHPKEALVGISAQRSRLTRIASDHLPLKAIIQLSDGEA